MKDFVLNEVRKTPLGGFIHVGRFMWGNKRSTEASSQRVGGTLLPKLARASLGPPVTKNSKNSPLGSVVD